MFKDNSESWNDYKNVLFSEASLNGEEVSIFRNISENAVIDTEIQEFRLYPNPSDDIINISLSLRNEGNISISLFNLNGSKVLNILDNIKLAQGPIQQTFSIGSLPKGIYLLKVENDQGSLMSKKIIRR